MIQSSDFDRNDDRVMGFPIEQTGSPAFKILSEKNEF